MARGGLQLTQPSLAEMLAARATSSTSPSRCSENTPVLKLPEPFANTPGLTRHEISRYDDRGPAWAWYWLEIGEHVGTHFDAPIHWITGKDGEDVASRAAERLVGPGGRDRQVRRGRRRPRLLLTVDDVRAFEAEHGPLPEGGWLLLRTGWDARAHDEDAFLNATRPARTRPASTSSARAGSRRRARLVGVGVETVGTDAGAAHSFDPPFPVHNFLLGAGKYGLTQLANLARAAADRRGRDRRAAQARARHRQPGARAGARAIRLSAVKPSRRSAGRPIRGRSDDGWRRCRPRRCAST